MWITLKALRIGCSGSQANNLLIIVHKTSIGKTVHLQKVKCMTLDPEIFQDVFTTSTFSVDDMSSCVSSFQQI